MSPFLCGLALGLWGGVFIGAFLMALFQSARRSDKILEGLQKPAWKCTRSKEED